MSLMKKLTLFIGLMAMGTVGMGVLYAPVAADA